MVNNLLSIHAKSFSWAGFFLPSDVYKNGSDLYDFCRILDDIADEEISLEIKKKKFLNYKNDFINHNFENDSIKKIHRIIKNFDVSEKIVLDLFDGIESDLKEKIEFKSKRELLVYSYRVAGTVGLMMAKILRVKSKTALKSAIDLGIAMQLTNISRDVIEDREKNREYIKHDISNIKNTITTADLFYNSCFNSIREIPIRCRFAILVARRVYREIGYKIIKKRDIDEYNQSGKIYVTKSGKIVQTILSIFDFFRLLFIQSDNYYRNEEHNEIGLEINIDERI